jgi:hypothetical protein
LRAAAADSAFTVFTAAALGAGRAPVALAAAAPPLLQQEEAAFSALVFDEQQDLPAAVTSEVAVAEAFDAQQDLPSALAAELQEVEVVAFEVQEAPLLV